MSSYAEVKNLQIQIFLESLRNKEEYYFVIIKQ